jgi:dTDP-4-amino-4,6-dideoxygalactose transaminase
MSATALEHEVARLLRVDHAVTFGYARHALINLLLCTGSRPGDAVVLSPLTCKMVPLALLAAGLAPVYADVSAETLNLAPSRVADAIAAGPGAVLFQHTYGDPAGITAVAEVAAARSATLIEDCAHCLPAAGDDPSPGRVGRGAVFSNNLRKPLPAGSGGVAVTDDAALAARLREIRDAYPRRSRAAELALRVEIWLHAHVLRPSLYWPLFELSRRFQPYYRARPLRLEIDSEITQRALRISEYQAREGARWLAHVDAQARHRRQRCAEYAAALSPVQGLTLPHADAQRPLYYFPVLVERKDDLLREARRLRIELVAWPLRTPIFPIEDDAELAAYGYQPGSCPVAEDIARRIVGLPTDPPTTPRHRDAVIALLERHQAGR